MAVTYKDISLLSQKATIAGTEKIPVSAINYVTTSQIASLASTLPSVTSGDYGKFLWVDFSDNTYKWMKNAPLRAGSGVLYTSPFYSLLFQDTTETTLELAWDGIRYPSSDWSWLKRTYIQGTERTETLQDVLDTKATMPSSGELLTFPVFAGIRTWGTSVTLDINDAITMTGVSGWLWIGYKQTSNGAFHSLQADLDAKPDVYSGSSAPSSSLGKNGDIYIQTS